MNLTKKRILSILTLLCFLCFVLSLILFNDVKVEAYTEVPFSLTTIKGEYSLNSNLNIEGKIEYESVQYDITRAELKYPSGVVYSKKQFNLNELGYYTLTLFVEDGKVAIKTSKQIKVTNSAFSVSSNASYAEYRENVTFRGIAKWDYTDDKQANKDKIFESNFDSIYAKIDGSDVFTYNQPLMLNEGETQIVSFFHNNNNSFIDLNDEYVGSPDSLLQARTMFFRITDAYDPSIYLEFTLWFVPSSAVYYRTQASGQESIGILGYNPQHTPYSVVIDGKTYSYFKNEYGSGSLHRGYRSAAEACSYKFSFNTITGECYVEDAYGKYMVNDVKNTDIHETAFKGFTNGEVYLSVYGADYTNTSYFEVNIESIGGKQAKELIPDDFDTTAPKIIINAPNIKNICIAKDEEFTVFEAKSFDVNSNGAVQTKVYYDYGRERQVLVYSKDGKFTPDKIGAYTIEYTAEDYYGNKTVETIVVNSIVSENNKALNFKVDKLGKIYAGKKTQLPEYTVRGINGEASVETFYEFEGKRYSFNENFIPKKIGEYKIIYRYFDNVSSYEYSYSVTCYMSDGILPVSIPILPSYILKGADYTFEPMYINTFDKPQIETYSTEVYISKNGGEYFKIDYNKYKVDFDGELKLKYIYKNWSYETPSIKIIDVGYSNSISMGKYFVGDVTTSETFDGVLIKANQQNGEVKVDFANLVSLSNFEIGFKIPQNASSFNELVITLSDSEGNTVDISYLNKSGLGYANINTDIYPENVSKSLSNTPFANTARNFTYNATSGAFIENSGVNLENLVGLLTDNVNLSITFKGIKGYAGIQIYKLLNQSLSNVDQDYIEPTFCVENLVGGLKNIGQTICISPIGVYDVLSPIINENVRVYVKKPNGEFAKDNNGVVLNGVPALLNSYEISLSDFGTYKYYYEVNDSYSNYATTRIFDITVIDVEKPSITIKGVKNNATVTSSCNTGYRLPNYDVSDNDTAVKDLRVVKVIVSPTNEMIIISKDQEFVYLDRLGEWKVIYYCYDNSGNYAQASYKISVK